MCTSHCFTGCGAGCPQSVLNRAGRRSTGQRIGLPKLSNFPHRDHRSADRDHPPIDCHGRRSRGLLRCGLQHRRGDSLGRHWPVRRGCPRCAPDTDKSGHKGPARSGSPHSTSRQSWSSLARSGSSIRRKASARHHEGGEGEGEDGAQKMVHWFPPGFRFRLPFQSSSGSRVTAGAAGFLTFSQQTARPDRYAEPRRFDTIPSQPSAQACL